MFLKVQLIADWQAIAHTCEHHDNGNLQSANRKQYQFGYALRQQVLKKVHNPTKLGVRTESPYTIERIHVNGNLTILCCKPPRYVPYKCIYVPYNGTFGVSNQRSDARCVR
jgi:hypothetical protein